MVTKQPQPEVSGSSLPRVVVRNSGCIALGLEIKGEITGSEDMQIDGSVEGTIVLPEHKLTVGRSGQLSCNVDAREVLVYGRVVGNIRATDLIEIKKDGSVLGDIRAARVRIEDGAHFQGYVDMERFHVSASLKTPIVPTDGAAN
jgi:cytoskeletal protein CcmA (bactofilin family)